MSGLDSLQILFVITAFLFQVVLILHFALRKWRFATAMRYGPLVYALSIPALMVSLLELAGGQNWSFGLAGFLYLAWAIYGYRVEYIRKIQWRTPLLWQVAGPYLTLYLSTVMFYWWPLALIDKSLWSGYAILFLISTGLNLISHQTPEASYKSAA